LAALSVSTSSFQARGLLNIAFLACNRNPGLFHFDPSFVYRCENLGLALQAMGHRVNWLHWSALRLQARFDVVVFHRPRFSLLWRALLWNLRRRGTIVVADVDDLVFDPALAAYSPGVLNGLIELAKMRRQFKENLSALAAIEKVTVSTQPLAEHVERCLPGTAVRVLPNAVHLSWRAAARDRGSRVGQPVVTPVVTYFPGTRSHDRDFSVYAAGVERFLAAHGDARLEVTGPLRFTLRARAGQVVHQDKVPFADYAERVGDSWVNLAPLESTPFTRCKSALKVLEAGFLGRPTISSPLPDAERFAAAGALFAEDDEACCATLEALTAPQYYAALTADLSPRVLAQADAHQCAAEFLRFIGAPHVSEG
jgi:hypothetical protein